MTTTAAPGAPATPQYSAANITILKGLEPVRKRPAMYIGSTDAGGLHHLLWEIVDNSVDEALNGHANAIEVTLHSDGQSMTVRDNGRGIPVDIHPVEGRSALEIILTTLHAGGKFEGGNYKRSGGLHGVGSSVVNALSTEMAVKVKRDGKLHEQRFSRGIPQGPVTELGEARGSGTSVFFRPDPEIFDDVDFDTETIAKRLEMKSYLTAGVKLVFKDEAKGTRQEFKAEGGIADLLVRTVKQSGAAAVHPEAIVLQGEEGEEIEVHVALQWTEATSEEVHSFANGIPTKDGGTHEMGLRDGVAAAMMNWLEAHDAIPRGVEVKRGDIREGLVAVVSVFLGDPQFQGQTKDRLNNAEVKGAVHTLVRKEVERTMHANGSMGNAVAMRIIQAAKARAASRSAANQVRRKKPTSTRLNLPGKLADCSSNDSEQTELFIVEGDSAGGSAKQGRDRRTMAVLPLRGKVLNVESATAKKVAENKELADIVSALGCGLGRDCDASSLRYGRIILLMDADSDGHHIATLLLTFFYRYMRPLIDAGRIYVAQPPLYRVDVGKETHWCADDRERDRAIAKAKRRRGENAKVVITRFKGLGEMMPKTLFETTLDPKVRRLLRVTVPSDAQIETEKTMSGLMGKDASIRFDFIMENAAEAEDLDL
ncbi:MAG: type IIA DNA topoisomerase subunit B [Deltaproteobacteria bacterium]|nr:type IIA DNA topoisomerase subunit B [Deltaproteobacteria bacterium]